MSASDEISESPVPCGEFLPTLTQLLCSKEAFPLPVTLGSSYGAADAALVLLNAVFAIDA